MRNRQTLETLLQQNPASFKGVRFTCEATITSVAENRYWNYPSCSQCSKNQHDEMTAVRAKIMESKTYPPIGTISRLQSAMELQLHGSHSLQM
uniref:Uncharacterized protein n=1 Tax=Tanacetum cinerariifolium TaxID=118510 RepID=A0A6L2LMP8_TANCI|nr:hypothetical protein [Tanacetum cinerariifolium]